MSMFKSTVRRATRSMWENFYFNAVSTGVIAAALLLMGVYLTVQHNVNGIVDSWNRDAHISAYFSPSVSRDRQVAIQAEVEQDSRVAHVEHLSPMEAQAWLIKEVEGLEGVLTELGPEALPASLEIELKESSAEPNQIAGFADELQQFEFEDVDYGQEWIQRFNGFLNLLKLLGAVMGLLILLAALFIVTNTVYLVVYSRRDELETQKLVGATSTYITIPFLIEGLIQGTIGSIVALAGLYTVHQLLVARLDEALQLGITQELAFLPPSWLLILALAGVVLGVGAALVAVTRFLAQAP
jgi:cell division transport system permease protein